MQTFNFLDSELLDILFRGKNKQYGAYTLRKFYPQRIVNSMAITAGLILIFFTIHFYSPSSTRGGIYSPFLEPDAPVIKLQDLILPKVNDGQAGVIPPLVEDTYSIPTEIVENITAIDIIPKPAEIIPTRDIITSTGSPGPIATPGLGGKTIEGIGVPINVGTKTGATTPAPTVKIEPSILGIAEVMPEFPGGLDELMNYLKKHIRYPRLASMRGVEGTVHVQFVVSTTGAISNVKVLSSVGAGCDEEASRVIRNMPKWTPGIQNGHKVNVEYMVPVKFEL